MISPSEDTPLDSPDVSSQNPDESPQGRTRGLRLIRMGTQARWLFLFLILSGLALYAMGFSAAPSPLVLLGLAAAAVIIILNDAEFDVRSLPATIRHRRTVWQQRLQAIRQNEAQSGLTIAAMAAAALILMALSAASFVPRNTDAFLDDAIILMLAGGLVVGIPILANWLPDAGSLSKHADLQSGPSRPGRTLAGVICLLLSAEMSGHWLKLPLLDGASIHIQFVVFLAGVILLGLGLSKASPSFARTRTWMSTHRSEILPVALVAGLALVLRVWGLDTTLRYSIDEGVAVQGPLNIWWNHSAGLAAPPSTYISTYLYPYIQTIVLALGGPSVVTMRLLGAIVGTLNIAAVYFLARTLFDKPVGLVAALMLATFPPHLHFSRLALVHIADPLVGTLAIAFGARALKDNRRADWVITGIALGLSQYFFEAGRLFFPLFMIVWLISLLILAPRRMAERSRGLVIMAIAAILVALPVYYAIFAQGTERTARFSISGVGAEYFTNLLADGISGNDIANILGRFLLPFQAYVRIPPTALFYGGNSPMILAFVLPCFLLGLAYMVWRLNPLTFGAVLWILLVPLSNGLLREIFVYARYVVVFPAIAVAVAAGIVRVVALLVPARFRVTRFVLLTSVILCLGTAQVVYYFDYHLPVLKKQLAALTTARDGLDAALRANEQLEPHTQIYLIGDPVLDVHPIRQWLTMLRNNREDMLVSVQSPSDITDAFISALPAGWNYAFFVAPDDQTTLAVLKRHFTLGEARMTPYDVPPEKQFALYYVSQKP